MRLLNWANRHTKSAPVAFIVLKTLAAKAPFRFPGPVTA